MLNELHYFFAINDSRGMRANAAAAPPATLLSLLRDDDDIVRACLQP